MSQVEVDEAMKAARAASQHGVICSVERAVYLHKTADILERQEKLVRFCQRGCKGLAAIEQKYSRIDCFVAEEGSVSLWTSNGRYILKLQV